MKIRSISLALLMLPCLFANAEPVLIDSLYYFLDTENHTASVTSRPDERGVQFAYKYKEISIPSVVNYKGEAYNVTSIGEGAFYHSSINSISIPNSIASIEKRAFVTVR